MTRRITKYQEGISMNTVFFDLDGTISLEEFNNTFDFIELYYCYHKCRKKLLLKYVYTILMILMPYSFIKKRRILINLLFNNIVADDLTKFTKKCYLPIFHTKLNYNVVEKIKEYKKKGYHLVLLTACTEIPAKIISKDLGFDDCISTTFIIKDKKICGVDEDNFGDLKISALEKNLKNREFLKECIYYTDDTKNEKKLISLFKTAYIVKDTAILRYEV